MAVATTHGKPVDRDMGETLDLLRHLRAMRAVLAVSQHGSTVRAAKAMHVSQPGITRSIIEFERACDVPLFSRATRGMEPTVLGSRLAARADALFQHLACASVDALAASPLTARAPKLASRFHAVVVPAQLRAVVAIAACGSESRAAESLGVTQPAVHAALQGVEELATVRLFYKLSIGTRLTPAGQALLRRVKLALAEVSAMERDIAAWKGNIRGRVVVGVLPLSVGIFLPRAIEALAASYPNIEVQIVDGTYESLAQQMLSAEVDVIAGALRAEAFSQEMKQLHLFDDDLVVVARSGHPCLQRRLRGLGDLLQWPWVTPLPGTPADNALNSVFRSRDLSPPDKGLQASSPAMTLSFVMQTGRLALASRGEALIQSYGGQLCIVPLSLDSTMRRIGVATRAMGEPSQDLQLFLDACLEAVPVAIGAANARPRA